MYSGYLVETNGNTDRLMMSGLQSHRDAVRLRWIKLVHTAIWAFFNVVIFYLLWAVITDHTSRWVWIGLCCFLLEGIVLVAFNYVCPLTIIARKYSGSSKANFDIYLPEWLAKHNKVIYTSILVIILLILGYRLGSG